MDVSNERRIVILGKTGAGKSSLANTIFGEELFMISHDPNSETRKCQAKHKSVSGRSITLIDTPGFFDTDRSEEELRPEIVRCITECAPGPHAFLIVLKVERFTKHEQEVIHKIQEYFSEEAFKYATVVFTHGEQLNGQKIEDFVFKNRLISDLVNKCGGRFYVIDNRYWNNNPTDEYRSNQFHVEKLLKTIDEMVMKQNRSYYTNEMLQKVVEIKILMEESIRQESGNMTEEEIREEAKSRVYKVLIRLAGVGTGALLGALLGVAALLGAVITASQIIPQLNQTLAAIGSTAEAPVIIAVAVGTSAAVGAVIGGVQGYHAAEGADTPWEAATRAAEAIENQTLTVCSTTKDRKSHAKRSYNL